MLASVISLTRSSQMRLACASSIAARYIRGCAGIPALSLSLRRCVVTASTQAPSLAEVRSNPDTKREAGRRKRPWFTTLDPARLTPADFCDLSGVYTFEPLPREGRFHFMVYYEGCPFKPFPPRTQGFFYYTPLPDARPDEPGEIRFRVTPDDNPANFAAGHDLLCHDGLPWQITLFRVDTSETLRTMLLRDKLVTPELLSINSQRFAEHLHTPRQRVVSGIGRPFSVNYQRWKWRLRVVVGCEMQTIQLGNPSISGSESDNQHLLFKGQAICCFERSPLPKHAGRRVLVIRVLKIVNPVEPVVPLPSTRAMDIPREGALLTVKGRPVFFDVDRRQTQISAALRLLFTSADTQKPSTAASQVSKQNS